MYYGGFNATSQTSNLRADKEAAIFAGRASYILMWLSATASIVCLIIAIVALVKGNGRNWVLFGVASGLFVVAGAFFYVGGKNFDEAAEIDKRLSPYYSSPRSASDLSEYEPTEDEVPAE